MTVALPSARQQRILLVAGTALAATAAFVYWKRRQPSTINDTSHMKRQSGQTPHQLHDPSSLTESFEHACACILPEIQDSLSTGEQLLLYALYKQATVGDAPIQAPPIWQIREHAKHSSWNHLRHMSFEEAMAKYVYAIHEFQKQVNGEDNFDEDDDDDEQDESSMTFAPVTSRPAILEQDDTEHDRQSSETQALFFQAAASNDASQLQRLLQKEPTLILARDGVSQTALHLAADKNSVDSLKVLLAHPDVNVNVVDQDGISVLQVAAIAGNSQVCRLLLQSGADPDAVDQDGDSPRSCVEDDGEDELKALFAQYKPRT